MDAPSTVCQLTLETFCLQTEQKACPVHVLPQLYFEEAIRLSRDILMFLAAI